MAEHFEPQIDHDEALCVLCQKYIATVIATPEERQRYRRTLRAMGFQTHSMHNYDVEGTIVFIEQMRQDPEEEPHADR